MSDTGSSWWLGADRLWRKGQPPSGWHQTRDGLWHPPPTAATRLKVEASSPAPPSSSGYDRHEHHERQGHEHEPHEPHGRLDPLEQRPLEPLEPPAPVEPLRPLDADAPLGEGSDDAGGAGDSGSGELEYETRYYDPPHRDDDLDGDAEIGPARHMAGGRPPERWSVADRVMAWPTWVRVAVPSAAAMVVLLAGLGLALADMGGGQAPGDDGVQTGGSSSSGSFDGEDEYAGGDTGGTSSTRPTTASSVPPGQSTSVPSTDSATDVPDAPATAAATRPTTPGQPGTNAPGDPGDPSPPPRDDPPGTPSPSTPSPPPTTPPAPPPDPYHQCNPIERLLATDPDGDGIYCE
jgi:hypothetical protein